MGRRDKFKKYPGLRSGQSTIAGTGCFAAKFYRKGDLIGEYTGERISAEEADNRYEDEEMTYLFEVNEDECIDAMHDPNPVKYINHSCAPNCESIQDEEQVHIYAVRDIQEGEELTYDYYLVVDENDDDFPCMCGAPMCRGTMAAPKED